MIKVLVVDDSALVRKLFGRVLTAEPDFEISFARNGVEALEQLESVRPNVITLDVNMPQMDGLECLDRIMVRRPCPVVMVSTITEQGADATLQALRLGAVDFVAKPSGAVSLHIDDFAPFFVEKIRTAASAKLPSSKRLRERVQFKFSAKSSGRHQGSKSQSLTETIEPAVGDGVVVVGTSTGGPPALEALLVPLPANFSWPLVIAQHMPATFTGALAKRLNNLCEINVLEVSVPTLIQPGCAYIGRGDSDIVITRRAAGLTAMIVPAEASYPWHPSMDRLVRSAMEYVPATQLVGILMTGMGNDGAAALTELHAKGGRTIAEAEETAIVWGMPGELVRAQGASWVAPLPKIAECLMKQVPSNATHT